MCYGKMTKPSDFGCHGNQIDQLAMVYMVKLAVFKHMACERSAGGNIGWTHLIFHRHVATGQFTKTGVLENIEDK